MFYFTKSVRWEPDLVSTWGFVSASLGLPGSSFSWEQEEKDWQKYNFPFAQPPTFVRGRGAIPQYFRRVLGGVQTRFPKMPSLSPSFGRGHRLYFVVTAACPYYIGQSAHYISQCARYIVQRAHYIVYCAPYIVHCAHYIVQSAHYIVHRAHYIVQCADFNWACCVH